MIGSNRPRSRPTRIIASRSSSERCRNRPVSLSSRPRVLTTSAPSKLSCAISLTSARSCWALVIRGAIRREYTKLTVKIAGNTTNPTMASTGSVSDQRHRGDDQHDQRAAGERQRGHRVPAGLDVGVRVGQQRAGRVLLVPGQREPQVLPGDPAPVRGLQPVLHDPGADPPADDADDLEDRDAEDERGRAGQRAGRGVARPRTPARSPATVIRPSTNALATVIAPYSALPITARVKTRHCSRMPIPENT